MLTRRAATHEPVSRLREANWQIPAVFLPPELLSDIFIRSVHLNCCQDIGTLHEVAKKGRKSFGGVCYRWREVVKATQALWAITNFPPPPSVVRNPARLGFLHLSPHTFERYFYELNLAGTAPLTLISRCGEYPIAFPKKTFPQLGRYLQIALFPVFARCEQILLEAPGQLALTLLNSCSTQLTKVKSLELRAQGFIPNPTASPSQVLDLSHAHSMQNFSLTFTRVWVITSLGTMSPMLPDMTKLRTLTLTGFVDSMAAYNIISRASSLRSLVWSPAFYIPPFHPPPHEIKLPFLQYLKLDSITRSIVPHLHAPELRALNLGMVSNGTQPMFPQPSQFINLRALNLTGWLDRPFSPALETFLCCHPSLELFNVQDTLYTSIAVACRTVPNLATVIVDWYTARNGRGYDEMLEGPRLLLDHWSEQIAPGTVSPISRKLMFVNESTRSYDQLVGIEPDTLRGWFPQANGVDIQVKLSGRNTYARWQPEDWDRWLQQDDPSYEPIF